MRWRWQSGRRCATPRGGQRWRTEWPWRRRRRRERRPQLGWRGRPLLRRPGRPTSWAAAREAAPPWAARARGPARRVAAAAGWRAAQPAIGRGEEADNVSGMRGRKCAGTSYRSVRRAKKGWRCAGRWRARTKMFSDAGAAASSAQGAAAGGAVGVTAVGAQGRGAGAAAPPVPEAAASSMLIWIACGGASGEPKERSIFAWARGLHLCATIEPA